MGTYKLYKYGPCIVPTVVPLAYVPVAILLIKVVPLGSTSLITNQYTVFPPPPEETAYIVDVHIPGCITVVNNKLAG